MNADRWDPEKKFENFGPEPMTFPSRSALREYCKRHGKKSGALL